jgi:hypothetical protein
MYNWGAIMEIYERNINITIERVETDIIKVRTSLLDLDHNIMITMTIRISTREILDVTGEMIKVPYSKCTETLANLPNVTGLKVERGLSKQVATRIGGSSGCTHLFELVLTSARMASNAILGIYAEGKDWTKLSISDEVYMEKVKPYLKNTCIVFKE